MDETSLVRVRLQGGRYEGILTAPSALVIEAVLDGDVVASAKAEAEDGRTGTYRVSVALPASVIGAGVQVVQFRRADTGDVLDRITLMAGAVLDEDIRAEVALLRAELEMLKRAIRQGASQA